MLNKLYNKYRGLILYGILGGTGALTDLVIYTLLVQYTPVAPVVANIISTTVGICTSFILNSRINFKKYDRIFLRFITFFTIGLAGTVLSVVLIFLLFNVLGLHPVLAKIISIPPVVLLQYLLNKHISFSEDPRLFWKRVGKYITTNPWVFVALLTVIIFTVNAPYYNFVDENDNLLGAQRILKDGAVLYKDYFSHHMPLTYFVALPFMAIFSTNVVLVKISFGIVMAAWLLFMGRPLRKFGTATYAIFLLGIAITQPLAWSHMLLAETLTAFAVIHALILFLTRDTGRSLKHDGVLYGILGAIPILATLSFAPLTLAIYLLFILQIVAKKRIPSRGLAFSFVVSAAVPYLLFVGYLLMTSSAGEFIADAIKFNTLYYSQFTPEAGRGIVDSLLTVPIGSFNGLYNALTFAPGAVQPFAFIWALCCVLGVIFLFVKRYYLEAIAFTGVLSLGASRSGFEVVFSASDRSRAGIIIALVGMLLFANIFRVFPKKQPKPNDTLSPFLSVTPVVVTLSLLLLLVASMGQISKNIVNFKHGVGTIATMEEAGSPSRVINIVNGSSGYYWLGPIDFSSQLIIQSRNASEYQFYTPWIASCQGCTEQVITDIRTKKPTVVVMDNSMSIWGIPVRSYDGALMTELRKAYYQLPDIRLRQYFFLTASKDTINDKLGKAGYELYEKP